VEWNKIYSMKKEKVVYYDNVLIELSKVKNFRLEEINPKYEKCKIVVEYYPQLSYLKEPIEGIWELKEHTATTEIFFENFELAKESLLYWKEIWQKYLNEY